MSLKFSYKYYGSKWKRKIKKKWGKKTGNKRNVTLKIKKSDKRKFRTGKNLGTNHVCSMLLLFLSQN